MSESKRSSRVPQPGFGLDDQIGAMIDRVRQVFGDEILAAIYGRAHNAAIRQALAPASDRAVPSGGRLRLISKSGDEGFVRALRDELDRALTHQ
jgi:hypothetical protein